MLKVIHMANFDYINQIKGQFRDFLTEMDSQEGHTHLQDYFASWLDSGECAQAVGGRFDTYMRVVVRVIDEWQRDPTLEGAIRQPVEGIMNPEESGAIFIDPEYFAVVAFNNLMGRQ